MRIGFVSDTHMEHGRLKLPKDLDLLVHAGDATNEGTVAEIGRFGDWCRSLPYPVIFVPGNHEIEMQKRPEVARALLHGVAVLVDEPAWVGDFTFYGSPWTPQYGDMAFEYKREDAEKQWRGMKRCDVLVTHGPPRGILDRHGGEEKGCWALRDAVLRLSPKIHVFGHIHDGYGLKLVGSTLFINASSMHPERRKYLNWPIVVEI